MATANQAHFANIADLIKKQDGSSTPLWAQTIVLFGEYGSGKSTLAAAFEDHAYYDIEHGAQNLDRNELNLPNTWAAFSAFVEQLFAMATAGETLPFKTLIIDTGGDLFDLCQKHVFAQYGWSKPEDGDRGEGWIAPRREFKRVVDLLLRLHKGTKLGTVFVCHEDTIEEKVGLTYSANVAVPKIGDKDIRVWLPSKAQIVIRAAKTNVNPMDAADVWDTRKFILQTKAGEAAASVKDRTNRLPAFLPTNYAALEAAYNKDK
jgi:hypothetical protein